MLIYLDREFRRTHTSHHSRFGSSNRTPEGMSEMAINGIEINEKLAAEQIIAQCMAHAWRRPGAPSQSFQSPIPFPPDSLRYAWDVITAHQDSCLSPNKTASPVNDRNDIEDLISWLDLEPSLRTQQFDSIFGLVISKDCPPYETEYLPWNDPTHRAQHLADIAGFYQAFGVEPDPHSPERHDHLSLELDFLALLFAKLQRSECFDTPNNQEHHEITKAALEMFLKDHLLWWVPKFSQMVENLARVRAAQASGEVQRVLKQLEGVARLLGTWSTYIHQAYVPAATGKSSPIPLAIAQLPQGYRDDEVGCSSCE